MFLVNLLCELIGAQHIQTDISHPEKNKHIDDLTTEKKEQEMSNYVLEKRISPPAISL